MPPWEKYGGAASGPWGKYTEQAPAPQGQPLSLGERFMQGVVDPVIGLAQTMVNSGAYQRPETSNAAVNAASNDVPAMAQQMNQNVARDEAAYQARRGSNGMDWARLGGNIVGTIPAAAVMPGTGATLAATAVKGALGGAGSSLLQPVTDATRPFWGQKLDQAKVGAITGGIAAPAMQLVGRAISPKVDDNVQYLMDRGVRPRPGQIIGNRSARFEDKAQSIPVVGDAIAASQRRAVETFNKAAYNEVLKPIGKTFDGDVGRDGFAAVERMVKESYDEILPNVTFKADTGFIQDFRNIAQMAQSLPDDQYRQFERVMQTDVIEKLNPTGAMDGISFKQMEEKLGRFARQYVSSPDPDQRSLGQAVREIISSARESLARTNPAQAEALRKTNQAFATMTRVQDAVSRVGTQEGVFTPAQLLSAVRAGDKTIRKSAFARGDALLQRLAESGKSVLGNTYPDSGTAGRMMNVAGIGALAMEPVTTTTAGLAGAAMYTDFGQKLATALLTKRPNISPDIREILERAAVPAAVGGGLLASSPSFANQPPNFTNRNNRRNR